MRPIGFNMFEFFIDEEYAGIEILSVAIGAKALSLFSAWRYEGRYDATLFWGLVHFSSTKRED